MAQEPQDQSNVCSSDEGSAAACGPDKQPWQAPTLTFVEPTLTRHGPVQRVTGQQQGFFGSFQP